MLFIYVLFPGLGFKLPEDLLHLATQAIYVAYFKIMSSVCYDRDGLSEKTEDFPAKTYKFTVLG
jgi:hypothetical protein